MTTKTYIVTGARKIAGHAKGEEFTADMDPASEARLVGIGAIKVKPKPAKKSSSK